VLPRMAGVSNALLHSPLSNAPPGSEAQIIDATIRFVTHKSLFDGSSTRPLGISHSNGCRR
jgi:hypothetical protein